MRRRLFNLAASVSLVLCVVTAALWVRSFWWMDSLHLYPSRTGIGIHSWRGVLTVQVIHPFTPAFKIGPVIRRPAHELREELIPSPPWHHLGIGTNAWDVGSSHYRNVYLRHGSVVLLFAVPLLLMMLPTRRRPCATMGCPTCGYDLRASPDRCPECGSPAANAER
jgi:hypothetical protein